MSSNSNIQDQNLNATYNTHDGYFYACNNITTSIVKDIRQVQIDWQQIYQNNKQELNDLNERLRLFLSSFQTLEKHNSQLSNEIETFQKQILNLLVFDEQWNENYVSLHANLNTFSNEKYEAEADFEFNQLQIQIYEQLSRFFQQFNDERRIKLEKELQQLSITLANLKSSYQTSEKQVEELRITLENAVKQYLTLIREKCQLKKQQKQLNFAIQTLKSQLVCYKSVHAYAYQEAELIFGSAVDSEQYWALELDKCIERIRRDFETLYASIQCSMISYYDEKTIEMQTELEQTSKYEKYEQEQFLLEQQELQREYEQVQLNLSQEKEIQMKYEAEIARLEADLKAIQAQREKKFDEQNQLLTNGQEEIILIGQNIGEVRRSTINLEAEIIIYRHLLDSTEIRQYKMPQPPPTPSSEITEKVVVVNESKRKGPIGIKECAASGKYISLVNHSSTQDVDLSKWTLKRRFDSSSDILYTIPEGTRLKHGKELTIYSKIGADALDSSASLRTMTMPSEELITHDLVSWGMGNAVETILIDRNGEEKASHIQSLGFGSGHAYNE